MHLVDDENLVAAHLWRHAHLFDERADVLHGVVGGGIQFVNIETALLLKGFATLAIPTCLARLGGREAVDGARKDAGAGGFAHASWTAEEVGVCQFARGNGILQCRGQCALSHHAVER